MLAAAGWTAYLDFRVRSEFEGRRFALPARIYARPLELHAGLRMQKEALVQELRDLGYRDVPREAEYGWYVRTGEGLEIAMRPFVFWDGLQAPRRIKVSFDGAKVSGVTDSQGKSVSLARLEPLPIGGIYPAGNEDRVLVRLSEVPPHLVKALIAVEDHKFFTHHGFDLRGLARAALSLFSGKAAGRQHAHAAAGEELLPHARAHPLERKVTELVMAVLLEAALQQGRDPRDLPQRDLPRPGPRPRDPRHRPRRAVLLRQGSARTSPSPSRALLVGIVKGPTHYDPHRHPARALERRNLVLREAKDEGSLTLEQYSAARATSLAVSPKPSLGTSPYPAFVQLVHRQLRRDYDEKDLRSEGLRIFTTLDPRVQRAAEEALAKRLAQFDKDKRFGAPGLEGAVVVTDPQSGEVQALVGGRDPRFRGYNRAVDAVRPVGSLLKPAIYLTALSDPARYTLLTPIDDGPFVWKSRGAPDWKPANYDRQFHGQVPLRTALAQSYNVATARLGTELGVDKVLDNVRRLGVEREPMQPYASSLLGAVEFSPLDVAQMYQTIASGGFRTPLRVDPRGDHAGRQAAQALCRSPSSRPSRPSRCTSSPRRCRTWCAKAPARG